jgi:SAM-dependent methyltransferase
VHVGTHVKMPHLRGSAAPGLGCGTCRFQCSTLSEQIADPEARHAIDEPARANALSTLRVRNFRTIVEKLARLRTMRGRLLDVGCAHGWFLRAAAADGWEPIGVEPDPRMAAYARQGGHDVRAGMFPTVLESGEQFEALTFNDVFEHLPDVNAALIACGLALGRGGILAINLPDARGPFYRSARLLALFGIRGPLERMWQKGFPSPHLSYFTAPLLRRLASKHGFRSVHSGRLPSVALRGLWSRLRYDRSATVLSSVLVFAATCALLPVVRLFPPDISFEVFEATAERG